MAGTATKLAFTTQPSASTVAGVAFAAQPVVTIQDTVRQHSHDGDEFGDPLTDHGHGHPDGTTTGDGECAGIATLRGCNINLVGTNKVLTAAASGLTSTTTSPAFTITAADCRSVDQRELVQRGFVVAV